MTVETNNANSILLGVMLNNKCSRANVPVQRRVAQPTVRCNRLFDGP